MATIRAVSGPGEARNEQGIALLSVLMVMLMMTVLGIGALTMTGLDNRVAGFASSMEASSAAAEACIQTGVKVIQQVKENDNVVPTALLDNQTPPGPIPLSNKTQLEAEIGSVGANSVDTPIGPPFPDGVTAAVPNLVQTVGAYSVVGDIDYLYKRQRPGMGAERHSGYHAPYSGVNGGIDLMYRIDCVATNVTTGMRSRLTAVYACLENEGCQRI
ncbi:hypothetical protein ACO9S2_06000 [Nitrospira sp. NS4]|uniref:hypothetical protein n=1 Tax=Nitrospira sp. NS4 TaxID=3414498 RepID=UPI003C30EABD